MTNENFIYFRAESRLSDFYESKSNESDLLSPSPRSPRTSSLVSSWTSLDKTKLKTKIKALQKEKEEMQEYIDQLHVEKSELKLEIGRLRYDKESMKVQYESLKESFGAFKESLTEKEDPFVLRLALNQSRKDFSDLIEKVSFELQSGIHIFENRQFEFSCQKSDFHVTHSPSFSIVSLI